MDSPRDRQEEIEFRLSQYLDGLLDEADRAELEAELSADPGLRTELEALRRTDQLVRTWGRQIPAVDPERFVAEAARRRQAYERSRRIVRFYARSGPLAAAAVLALVVTGYLVVRSVTHPQIAPAPPVVMVQVGPRTVGASPDREGQVVAEVRFSCRRSVEPIDRPGNAGSTLLVAAAGAGTQDTVSNYDYDDEPPWL
jgi:anti-sigma factor RsiW